MNQGHTRFETRTTDDLLIMTCLGCDLDLVFAPGAPLRQRDTAMLLHAQNADAAPRERRSASGEREAARELRRRGLAPISGGSDAPDADADLDRASPEARKIVAAAREADRAAGAPTPRERGTGTTDQQWHDTLCDGGADCADCRATMPRCTYLLWRRRLRRRLG